MHLSFKYARISEICFYCPAIIRFSLQESYSEFSLRFRDAGFSEFFLRYDFHEYAKQEMSCTSIVDLIAQSSVVDSWLPNKMEWTPYCQRQSR